MESTYEVVSNNFWSNGPEVHIATFIGSLLVQWTRSGLIFMLAFTKIAPEIEVIAPPHLAEAFQIK